MTIADLASGHEPQERRDVFDVRSAHGRMVQRWLYEAAQQHSLVTRRSISVILDEYRHRLVAGEPLQYVLGTWQFRWLALDVDRRALIPRPETELLVDLVLAELGNAGPASILELGTGSGAVILAIAQEFCPGRDLRLVATERSLEALALAKHNIGAQLGVRPIELVQGYWYGALGPDDAFTVICSNPPYLAESEWDQLDGTVRDWEPREALVAGPTGLEAYMEIFGSAIPHLAEGRGSVVVEIGATQADDVRRIARNAGFTEVVIRQDYAGRDRFVVARRGSLG